MKGLEVRESVGVPHNHGKGCRGCHGRTLHAPNTVEAQLFKAKAVTPHTNRWELFHQDAVKLDS